MENEFLNLLCSIYCYFFIGLIKNSGVHIYLKSFISYRQVKEVDEMYFQNEDYPGTMRLIIKKLFTGDLIACSIYSKKFINLFM